MPLISAPSMAGETITVATMRTQAYSVKVGGAVSLNSCILVCSYILYQVCFQKLIKSLLIHIL